MQSTVKSALVVIALAVVVIGLTACAKYPVLSESRASSASTEAPTPSR